VGISAYVLLYIFLKFSNGVKNVDFGKVKFLKLFANEESMMSEQF
jgi:hypothetical protein